MELFGWNLYQVWSTDWYRNPARELERLLAGIEQAKTLTATLDKEYKDWQLSVTRDLPAATETAAAEYQLADIHIEHIRAEFQHYTFAELSDWISEVVSVESPVHFDEMAKRITDAAGITKLGSRIR